MRVASFAIVSPGSVEKSPIRSRSLAVALARGLINVSSRIVGALDDWRFCPRCAGTLEPADGHLACRACGFQAWANSVPGAQAVIEEGGRVLLGRRAFQPSAGLWDLPGGFLEEGEHPLDGLRRELREETGLETEPVEFLGAWMEPYWDRSVLCLTWTARRTGGEPAA